jgi:uncharacterized protein
MAIPRKMNKLVFADTSYWLALIVVDDQLHERVLALTETLTSAQFVTSEMVFTELLNSVSRTKSLRAGAFELLKYARNEARTSVVRQSSSLFDAALERYKRSADKQWSLTDCASFVIMEEQGIRQALTYDRHFEQAGFEALLR